MDQIMKTIKLWWLYEAGKLQGVFTTEEKARAFAKEHYITTFWLADEDEGAPPLR